jgi:hypothetical protein
VTDLVQFLVKTPVQPRGKFYSSGVLTDLDGSCTVTLTKPDGTAGPASGAVTRVSAGIYTFSLDGPTDPIVYDITWAGQIGGKAVTIDTQAEAVGEFLFNLADLRTMKVAGTANAFSDSSAYPDETLLARRVEVTDDFEQRTGYSFIPRFTRETYDGNGRGELVVRQRRCTKLLSVTIDGTAQSLSGLTLSAEGVLAWSPGGWFSNLNRQNVVVEYVYGFDRPPPVVSSAGLARAAMLLLPSQAGSTVSTWTTPDGTTYQRDLAGQSLNGGIRHYGVPGIDAVLNAAAYSTSGMA